VDGEIKRACVVAGGYPEASPTYGDIDAPDLPPVPVTLAGRRYTLPAQCVSTLGILPESQDRILKNNLRRNGFAQDVRRDCPAEFLNALADRIGASPDTLADALPALGQLVAGGFDVPGGGGGRPAQTAWADPRFREMCRQAAVNTNTCRQRQIDIGSCSRADDTTCTSVNENETKKSLSRGQNAAFGDCAALYGSVDRMCKLTEGRATMPPPAPLPVVAKPAPPPPPPAAKPIDGMAHSAPPPKPQPSRCQQLVSNYVSAAQANDGPRALAGYNALKAEGGCGVLDKVDTGMPAAPPAQAYPSRRNNTLTHQYVDPCAADPANCARAMGQLEQQAGPEAKAALMMHAISTGLQLGAAMANGLAAMQPQGGGGGGTNYNSIGNRPAARTYGQGSPQAAPHQQLPTPGPCGPGPVCTAR
jgi:hypothetical protein